ncbi:putative 39S ribosomal protein L21, mitochondrial [Hypsibius exemplaris]|uniref:Large ribosomal subunit protein bL21m n=1 Tax=Hypsibius exemplaris TaxID=2072580 RepID=A0A1W0WCY6_HYPEX|nr:putative 39S ribosomal protein L21, mitochondrial [Hypsibius exemplaris]
MSALALTARRVCLSVSVLPRNFSTSLAASRRFGGPPGSQIVPGDIYASLQETAARDAAPGEINFAEVVGDQRRNPFNPELLPEEVRYDDAMKGLTPEESKISQDILSTVNTQIAEESYGRLFAVIHLGFQQRRVTQGDIFQQKFTYHVALGQKIRLEKVLAVGSTDFTLLGRPLLDRNLVTVEAVCIEKTMSYPHIIFRHMKQIPYRHYRFNRIAETVFRINRISFNRKLNDLPDPAQVVHTIH